MVEGVGEGEGKVGPNERTFKSLRVFGLRYVRVDV